MGGVIGPEAEPDPVEDLLHDPESQDLLPGRDQNPEADRSLAQSKEKSPNQGHALNQNQDPSLVPDQGPAQDHPHEDRRGPDLEVLEMETRKQDQSLPRIVMQLMEKLVTMVLINFFSKNNCLWQ